MKTTCPSCNQSLKILKELVGKVIKCPDCNNTFTVPASPSPLLLDDKSKTIVEIISVIILWITVPFKIILDLINSALEYMAEDVFGAFGLFLGFCIFIVLFLIVEFFLIRPIGWACLLASTFSVIVTIILYYLTKDAKEREYEYANKNISNLYILYLSLIPIVISIILFFSVKHFFPKASEPIAIALGFVKSPLPLWLYGMTLTVQAVVHTNYRRVKFIINRKKVVSTFFKRCPNCASRNFNQNLEINIDLLGSKIECPKCRTQFLAE